MTLPPRIPKRPRRDSRWRSPVHLAFVRSHACCFCRSTAGIEAAHVRIGARAGISRKPDDWQVVSLCNGCHTHQHRIGEPAFWREAQQDPDMLIAAFIAASPKRREIEAELRERARASHERNAA